LGASHLDSNLRIRMLKLFTDPHLSATVKGGILGGIGGLVVAGGLVVVAHRRYHFFNQLTPQLKAFLITSGGTFTGIIAADHSSRAYEAQRNPLDRQYAEREKQRHAEEMLGKSWTERAMDFGRKERYKIVGGSWLASMVTAFAMVNRNKYLTGPQKLVQARVYAQFLTLGVLVASAAFEISDSKNDKGGLWETVKIIDPNDPEHKRIIEKREHKEEWEGQELWRDMVEAEEQRIKERERGKKKLQMEREKKTKSNNGGKGKDESNKGEKEE
jgi:Hypoxia induced protein conserved region